MPRSSTSMLRERRWETKVSLREQPNESAPAMIFRRGWLVVVVVVVGWDILTEVELTVLRRGKERSVYLQWECDGT